jgi:transcriptional regulator with XRE-family HTH domain
LGLSQEELAHRIGVSVSYVSLIEKNKRDPPMSTIQGIAVALGIPLSLLTFLGAEPGDLKGVPVGVREKLAAVTLKLLNAKQRA